MIHFQNAIFLAKKLKYFCIENPPPFLIRFKLKTNALSHIEFNDRYSTHKCKFLKVCSKKKVRVTDTFGTR